MIMKILFNVLLCALAGISCYEAWASPSLDGFVVGSLMLFCSGGVFLALNYKN
jgi:hypothetical protein